METSLFPSDHEHVPDEPERDAQRDLESDAAFVRELLRPLVLFWIAAIVLRLVTAVTSPLVWTEAIAAIEVTALYVIAAMLAGWVLLSVQAAMQIAANTMRLMAFIYALRLVLSLFGPPLSMTQTDGVIALGLVAQVSVYFFLNRDYFVQRWRLAFAWLIMVAGAGATVWIEDGRSFFTLQAFAAGQEEVAPQAIEMIPSDRLWHSQRDLVEQAATLHPLVSGAAQEGRVYLVVIAPDGTQELFEREGQRALDLFSGRYEERLRMSAQLTNNGDRVLGAPLATNGNLQHLADLIADDADPARDMVAVYLTAHGSQNAEASTSLPDYTPLEPVTAASLRDMLERTGIEKRLVAISACYSGSWIEPLATQDTIVLTAARKDRTSYGCSDDREMTFFGENFLVSDLADDYSLEAIFRHTRARIARDEKAAMVEPSLPQVFVGKNMEDVWQARPTRFRASPRPRTTQPSP